MTAESGSEQGDHDAVGLGDDLDRRTPRKPFSSTKSPTLGWLIGREPRTQREWFLEYDLLARHYVNELQGKRPTYLLGRPPENPTEIEAEIAWRDIDKKWEVERDDRTHRANLEYQAAETASRGEHIRGWVLLGVVASVVVSPWIALLLQANPTDFQQFIAPITGIAGTIIGYWFGQRGENPTSG